MAALTRRRDPDARQEAWMIHYGGVQVGTIAERRQSDRHTASAMDLRLLSRQPSRRVHRGHGRRLRRRSLGFETAWRAFLAKRTGHEFEECRRERARTTWKHPPCDADCRLPTSFRANS